MKKQHRLKSTIKIAKILNHTKLIKINRTKISQSKLENKFKRNILTLVDKIESSIPVVVSSNKKIKQLHELRKDCKKLRYLLELTNHDDPSVFIDKLKMIPDMLGSIRDCDIAIDFLKTLVKKYNVLNSVIKNESEKREQLYKKFVEIQS